MRPIRTVEIEVLETELLEGLVELSLDAVRLVRGVPELGGDEELLAGDDGRDDFLECTPDLVLVLVYPGQVEVSITIPDGDLDLDSGVSGD